MRTPQHHPRSVPELSESAWSRPGVAHTPAAGGWTSPRPQVGDPDLAPRRRRASEGAGNPPRSAPLFERGAALALLVLAAPALGLLLLFVLLADGRPVLYCGERLGLRRRPFRMVKVRTLRREAAQRTAERLLEARDRLEIRGGRFLRDSRLDELPQLWNIVRGEMGFVGPRPERERICRLQCQALPGYARRFEVRPGMLGPSQLFTPHATPKRIRAWLDDAWGRRERSVAELVGLTAFTAFVALRRAAQRLLESVRDDLLRTRILRRVRERRRLRRVRPGPALATLSLPAPGAEVHARLLDLNEEAMLVRSPRALRLGSTVELRVVVGLADGPHGARLRHARCTAVVRQRRRDAEGGHLLVLAYLPGSDRSLYVLHQYFLRNALACPRARGRGEPQPGRWRTTAFGATLARR